MSQNQNILKKLKEEDVLGLSESIWRNLLRNTPLRSGLEAAFSPEVVEKLVMTPRVGYWPQIKNPRSFNEKIVHRKFYTDDERFATVADKRSVRDYVRKRIGDDILNEVYYITKTPSKIPFSQLPPEVVIKTGNKGTIIVDDTAGCDKREIIKQCQKAIAQPYGVEKHEYWYADTEQSIIVERKLKGARSEIPIDYKFYVFHGEVKCVHTDLDRFGDRSMRFYTRGWKPLPFQKSGNQLAPVIKKPKSYNKMVQIAERLGSEFDFMRVDLYETASNGVIFGEMTPAPASGNGGFNPTKWDFILGSYW